MATQTDWMQWQASGMDQMYPGINMGGQQGGYAFGHTPADFTQGGSWAQQAGGQVGPPNPNGNFVGAQWPFGGGGGQPGNSGMPPGFNPNAPPPSFDQSKWNQSPISDYQRNIEQEGWGNFQAQMGMLPYQLDAQRKHAGDFADVQYDYTTGKARETAGTQADVMGDLQRGVNDATNSQRTSDSTGVGRFAKTYQGGLDEANPTGKAVRDQYATNLMGGAPQVGGVGGVRDVNAGHVGQANDALLGSLNQQAGSAGRTSLQQQQEAIAQSELAKGGSLGTEEVNNIVQQIRGRGESSGLVNSNRTFANELLGLDSVQRQRQSERMAQAQSTDAAGFGQMQGNRDFALGTVGQNRGLTGQNLQGSMFNVGTNMAGQQANQGADQFLSQLGFQKDATNAGMRQNQTEMQGRGMGAFNDMNNSLVGSYNRQVASPYLSPGAMHQNWQQTQQGEMTNPRDAYGNDVYGSNANANWAQNIQNQNMSQAKKAGYMDWAGQLFKYGVDAYNRRPPGAPGAPAPEPPRGDPPNNFPIGTLPGLPPQVPNFSGGDNGDSPVIPRPPTTGDPDSNYPPAQPPTTGTQPTPTQRDGGGEGGIPYPPYDWRGEFEFDPFPGRTPSDPWWDPWGEGGRYGNPTPNQPEPPYEPGDVIGWQGAYKDPLFHKGRITG